LFDEMKSPFRGKESPLNEALSPFGAKESPLSEVLSMFRGRIVVR
jgi:hypothetical protein